MTSAGDDSEEVAGLARDLRKMVARVSPEEFYWQDAHYDGDSRRGRELLFLMANHEWARATSEIVDLSPADSLETTIKIDIDLGQITHEAFRARTGSVWLPVTVLPPQVSSGSAAEPPLRLDPDPFATVTDAAGNLLPLLPGVDLLHQISAAMAEIIVNMAVAHWPGEPGSAHHHAVPGRHELHGPHATGQHADSGQHPVYGRHEAPGHAAKEPPVAARDERLLLAAAIYRMLRAPGRGAEPAGQARVPRRSRKADPAASAATPSAGGPAPAPAGARPQTPRITEARRLLKPLIDAYVFLLDVRAGTVTIGADKEKQFAPELARRAVKVLQALSDSIIIVVPMSFDPTPTVLTVKVPARPFRPRQRQFLANIRPSGRLAIDVLLPTADADRQIQVNLPDGVSFPQVTRRRPAGDAGAEDGPARIDIVVKAPPSLEDLSASLAQLMWTGERAPAPGSDRPADLARPFLDLARVKAAVASQTMRHYQMHVSDARSPGPGQPPRPADAKAAVRRLGELLNRAEAAGDVRSEDLAAERDRLEEGMNSLRRSVAADRINPRSVVARADVIEDVSQRAIPVSARIYANVTVNDRDYFAIARASSVMSLILMVIVWLFLRIWTMTDPALRPAPEVLAIVLTLFAAIQAGRIERPDRSTLRGELSAFGNYLIASSMLPPVTLAIALAFRPGGLVAETWTGICIALQIVVLCLMLVGQLTPRGSLKARRRRCFETYEPDYRAFDALRSGYWRSTTADALMIGRTAYGYVIWQTSDDGQGDPQAGQAPGAASPQIAELLRWPEEAAGSGESTNTLALLRSGTLRQATTFLVSRGKRPDPGIDGTAVDDLDLDAGRLAPMDSVTSTVDVFVAVPCDQRPVIREHPLVAVLAAATNNLIVLEAQLPVPEPIRGYGSRHWSRVRVALRDKEDIRRLADFLAEVDDQVASKRDYVVAVQTVPTVGARLIGDPPDDASHGDGRGAGLDCAATDGAVLVDPNGHELVLSSDINVVNPPGLKPEADGGSWRALTVCTDARSNIAYDMIEHVASELGTSRLAGLTYAQLHGTAVAVLLLNEPATSSGGESSFDDLAVRLRSSPAWSKLRIPVNKILGMSDLGPVTAQTNYPLLRVRFRWLDRPGAFLSVLTAIRDVLAAQDPAIPDHSWSVAFSRLQVANGRTALGNLTIRLHVPGQQVAGWGTTKLVEMERKVGTLAALGRVPNSSAGRADDDPRGDEDPVVSIRLMIKPPG